MVNEKKCHNCRNTCKRNQSWSNEGGNVNYISLTDLAKYQNSTDPSFTVKNWLRRITTIDYIGLWEQIHNEEQVLFCY